MSDKKILVNFDGVDRSEHLEHTLIEIFTKLDHYFEHVIAVDLLVYMDAGHKRLKVNLHLPQKHFYCFKSDQDDLYKAAHELYSHVYRKTIDFSEKARSHD